MDYRRADDGREFVDRSSLLLKFDPLLKQPVVVSTATNLPATAEESYDEELGEHFTLSTTDSLPAASSAVVSKETFSPVLDIFCDKNNVQGAKNMSFVITDAMKDDSPLIVEDDNKLNHSKGDNIMRYAYEILRRLDRAIQFEFFCSDQENTENQKMMSDELEKKAKNDA